MSSKISSGTAVIDELLQGGYETDALTTMYGPAGCGKTNLALLAAIAVVRLGKNVIYIDTEGGFSIERLKQLCADSKKILEHIIFLKPTSFEEQKESLDKLAKLLNSKIGLVIVDSMTMLYRLERSMIGEEGHSFNQSLGLQLRSLNQIVRLQNIPVIITSQVYANFEGEGIKLVGGDMLKYASKCLLEIQSFYAGKRKIIIRKHRSIAGEKEALFEIVNGGIQQWKQKDLA